MDRVLQSNLASGEDSVVCPLLVCGLMMSIELLVLMKRERLFPLKKNLKSRSQTTVSQDFISMTTVW